MTVSGLLKMKPDGPYPIPEVGQLRRFTVEQVPKRDKPEETWNRLKNQSGDFGNPYKVLKSDLTDHTDEHGNVSYSLLLEAATEEAPQSALAVSNGSSGDYQREYSPVTQERVNRHTAFEGAVLVCGARIIAGTLAPEELLAAVQGMTDELLPIVKGASSPTQPATEQEGEASDDIPF